MDELGKVIYASVDVQTETKVTDNRIRNLVYKEKKL